jgi:hypothetical protein
MPVYRTLSAFLIALLFLVSVASPPARSQPTNPPGLLLSGALIGTPATAGDYIFWKERDADRATISGYNLASGTRFLVAQSVEAMSAIASDGATVVWSVATTFELTPSL